MFRKLSVPEDHAEALFVGQRQAIVRRLDRLFVYLMLFQWATAVVLSFWLSPRMGGGAVPTPQSHFYTVLALDGLIALFPVCMALMRPGATLTRHVIAVGQMLMSALLIYLMGGRIETHFHVFVSLAFLACYRDWRVLISASLVVLLDHLWRGLYWPETLYGMSAESSWRWMEYGAWMLFEDVILAVAINQSLREMKAVAKRQSQLEESEAHIAELNAQLKCSMTETHHRVKNNLQMIASLVDMRLMDSPETIPASEVRRLGTYVGALAGVHDLLTHEAKQDGKVHHVSAHDILLKLLPLVQLAMPNRDIETRIGEARVTAKTATSLALVANELISNALKHSTGRVEVLFDAREGKAMLTLLDDGPGFPADFDPLLRANTGLELVETLVRLDLSGCVCYKNRPEGGGCVLVKFPLQEI